MFYQDSIAYLTNNRITGVNFFLDTLYWKVPKFQLIRLIRDTRKK